MKKTIILFIFCLCALNSIAQNNHNIKGTVADTSAKNGLPNATICILNAKDSVMRKFTYAVANGSFAISGLPGGNFILLVTYPDYSDYVEPFTLDANHPSHDFGSIAMQLTSKLLHDVIIKGTVTAIKFKGDTTEFNAKAYVIQPNDRVEDLIKQFPGIQVDKNGKITAQGQTVNKVLLDGEEFFGDDPTLVTKNIRADMVDKVQLYDKKSDQAAFTGIDDGVKIKTLNIKLKEDKKNGYFGKVDAGIGNDGYYQEQGMYNRFASKQKLSVYATDGNTGKTGLSGQDNDKYTSNSNDAGGNVLNYNNQGIPLARTGGVHYDTKWDNDKQSLNTNYRVGALTIDGTNNTLTQNTLPTGVINTNAGQTFNNYVFRQKLDAAYQVILDTTATLKITADGAFKNSKSDNNYLTISRRGDDTLLNRNTRSLTNNSDQHLFNASALYTKKLRKKGRTFSILLNGTINNNQSTGFLKSEADFYNNTGILDSMQVVNQYKTAINNNSVLNSNITYTEPLSKTVSVVLNYGLNINNSRSAQKSFNRSTVGNYNLLDTALTNDFKLDQLTNQAGAMFVYKKNKAILDIGTRVADAAFNQTDEYTGDIYNRSFVNWYPSVTYLYQYSRSRMLNIYYDGNTTQPSINQLLPVKVNNDPLNIYQGNQSLRPSFTNRISLFYNAYQELNNRFILLYGTFSYISNQIINNITTDAGGKSIIRYVNLVNEQPYTYSLSASVSRKVAVPDVDVALSLSNTGNTSYSYINNVLTNSNSAVYKGSLSFTKDVQKKYNLNLTAGPVYTVNESSLPTGVNSNGGGFNATGLFLVFLPAKVKIASDINYTYTAKTAAFNQDFKRTIWNASISKGFFKDDNLRLFLAGNDLLNQNIGFSRSANGSTITQNSYTTIKRYFMLSVTWDFNKMSSTPIKN